MTPRADIPMIAALGAIGWLAGVMFTPDAGWGVIGLVLGLGCGWLMARAGVRRAIGPAIVAGGVVGVWIGREIIRALCLPGSCTTVEVAGAAITGVGSMVGIGLVAALVVRSFDEYWETRRS